jgi:DNA-binding LacI/PurR family transcriptional regulator
VGSDEKKRQRPTISDVAARAGVAKVSVSYALNGRPGVSEATRRHILAVAAELGWRPNSTARALSGSRAGAYGLVLNRSPQTLAMEPFYMGLITGMESALAGEPAALLLQLVDSVEAEMAIERRWWSERRVDGIFIADFCIADQRVAFLRELGLPAVVIAGSPDTGGLPTSWMDDAGLMGEVLQYLAGLGHRRIARVAGTEKYLHVTSRTQAFMKIAREAGIDGRVVFTDFSGESGAKATRGLLLGDQPPTALIYDNDLMAVAGLAVAHELGVDVPRQVSIIAWDDSLLCQLVHPSLTAVSTDTVARGNRAAQLLMDLSKGEVPRSQQEPRGRLVPRGSTAPPQAP